ncbi:MAG: FG-GAP repeat protein, partial [Planctomycetes bacterium]|nr:FG-GAP repeat protein [Planctomycetota bacterium]
MDTDLSASDASFWGEDANDWSGYSEAGAGDVNGDGFDDIIISTIYNDDGGSTSGQTYLILGKATGWARDTDLSTADASFWGESTNEYSGYFVDGAGDVDGDGYDEILIGAYGNGEGGSYAGQIYLIKGMASGWAMDRDLSTADASFWGNSGDYLGVNGAGAGDVNGDGYDDFLMYAYADHDGGNYAGQTYLILSNARPPPPKNLQASLATATPQITLTWDAAGSWNEPIDGYPVYRSTNGFDFSQVGWKLPGDRTYVDTDVVYGRLYHYVVLTEDATGALSEWSATVSLYCDKDTDSDGVGNMADDDDDGDGVLDNRDAFPLNSGETMDTDGDGVGDNTDLDDDGDGVRDTSDAFPKNPREFWDADGDGIGDNLDPDDDNDGTYDIVEWQNSVNAQFTSLNSAVMQVQSNLRNDLYDVEGNLQDTMDALEGTLTDQNSNLMDELGNVNADLAADIQSLLDNITEDLTEVNASLAAELMAARDDILTDADALEAWLDLVLEALDDELASANTTLHDSMDGLGDDLGDYYTTLSSDLMGVMGQLLAVEGN